MLTESPASGKGSLVRHCVYKKVMACTSEVKGENGIPRGRDAHTRFASGTTGNMRRVGRPSARGVVCDAGIITCSGDGAVRIHHRITRFLFRHYCQCYHGRPGTYMNASDSPQLATSPLGPLPGELTNVCFPLFRPLALHRTADPKPGFVRSTH